ncbi:NAD(+) diphosphatase [Actinosynnema sp. NPDC047251]|uniref:NAD(+) diphosphatase n=1 Tax=Saccharothrix espanaensis (strain ATCC 51144 / DSM 44229 / JCM 9112 / NBRC 15066 / NRRL 15764) TaxID=1179773 RepID=K0JVP1_SACES|nr:NAD(+) diphosphatase [Saccharothrix espanaensis]CCH28278.1 NADH pyrophosphatase [Saccharothrix espanaensis DSM 44229]
MSFELVELPALSRFTVDRQEPLRGDAERLLQMWPKARVITVDAHGRTLVADRASRLVDRPATEFGDEPPEGAVLLGEQDGVAYWAVLLAEAEAEGGPAAPAGRAWFGADLTDEPQWLDLRACGALLDDTGAGLFTSAVALFNWHRTAKFCAVCGGGKQAVKAGWVRVCSQCGREEYPRTDAAVICLVHDGADQVLLARGEGWPEGRYSVLAGFVEAGESLEACVAREIAEEVGVAVSAIGYLGSQPWPFPRSLMVGFQAVGDPGEPLRLADGEIAQAKWVTRAEVRQALAVPGSVPDLLLAPGASIAYRMIQSWAAVGD